MMVKRQANDGAQTRGKTTHTRHDNIAQKADPRFLYSVARRYNSQENIINGEDRAMGERSKGTGRVQEQEQVKGKLRTEQLSSPTEHEKRSQVETET